MAVIETEAIVLKQFDLGEADKIITFYTKNAGKIRAVAKKARNSKNNKVSAVVLPYCYNKVKIYKSKSLDRINNVESIHRFESLRNNLENMAYAAYFAEMVEKVGMEYHSNPELFNLLLQTFYKMIRSSKDELAKINIIFKILFLKYIGVQPRINYCYECGKRYKTLQSQFFNVKEGGLICRECATNKDGELKRLRQNEVDLIKKVYRSENDALDELQVDIKLLEKIDQLINDFIVYHLDFSLKSSEFLQIVKGFDKN